MDENIARVRGRIRTCICRTSSRGDRTASRRVPEPAPDKCCTHESTSSRGRRGLLSPLLGDIDLWSGRLRALREPGAPGNRRPAGLAPRVRAASGTRVLVVAAMRNSWFLPESLTPDSCARGDDNLISEYFECRAALRNFYAIFRSLAQIRRTLANSPRRPRSGSCRGLARSSRGESAVEHGFGTSIPSIALCVTRAPSDPRAPPKVSARSRAPRAARGGLSRAKEGRPPRQPMQTHPGILDGPWTQRRDDDDESQRARSPEPKKETPACIC